MAYVSSLITVAALIAGGNTEQLPFHLKRGKENGLTETELEEVITHLAFYSGWPKSMSAIAVAKHVFSEDRETCLSAFVGMVEELSK